MVFDKNGIEEIELKHGNKCQCGKKLLPENLDPEETFSARAICPECYRKEKKKK